MAFFRFSVYSNLYVALCAAMLTAGSYGLMSTDVDIYLCLHVFGVTLVAYNVQRLARLSSLTEDTVQIAWYRNNRKLLFVLLGLGLAISLLTLFRINVFTLLRYAPLAILSFFYAVPFIPSAAGRLAIRDLPYAKIIIIALVWTGVTWMLPVGMTTAARTGGYWTIALQRFLFILAITIPFDIRDLRYDAPKLKTIPQLIGYSNSKALALSLLAVCFVIGAYNSLYQLQLDGLSITMHLGFYALVAAVVYRVRPDSPDIYYTGLLDGSMLFLGIILLIF